MSTPRGTRRGGGWPLIHGARCSLNRVDPISSGPSQSEAMRCEEDPELRVGGESREEVDLQSRVEVHLGFVNQNESRLSGRDGSEDHDELSEAGAEFCQLVALAVDEDLQGRVIRRGVDFEFSEPKEFLDIVGEAIRRFALLDRVSGLQPSPRLNEGLTDSDVEVGLICADVDCISKGTDVERLAEFGAEVHQRS